jgi:hypothetical protein
MQYLSLAVSLSSLLLNAIHYFSLRRLDTQVKLIDDCLSCGNSADYSEL